MSSFSLLHEWIPVTQCGPRNFPCGEWLIVTCETAHAPDDDVSRSVCTARAVQQIAPVPAFEWQDAYGRTLKVLAFMPYPDPFDL